MKFKVNDKAMVILDKNSHGFTIGDIVEILRVDKNDYLATDGTNAMYITDEELKPIKTTVVFYSDDNKTVTAIKKINNTVVGKSKAICHEDDVFDFNTGINLCLEKLKYINGDIVCTKSVKDSDFTAGRIYHCKNGKFKDDRGNIRPLGDTYLLEGNFNITFGDNKFIKIIN